MRFMVCPFCGVASEVAHCSQEACIEALQSEIDRTRAILSRAAEAYEMREAESTRQEDNEQV
jgi:hypothetical protein